VSELADAVRALAAYDRRSPALLVATPTGSYHVSANGFGDGSENVYVISRAQLHTLMAAQGMRRADLTNPDVAERLAEVVSEFQAQRARQGMA